MNEEREYVYRFYALLFSVLDMGARVKMINLMWSSPCGDYHNLVGKTGAWYPSKEVPVVF